MRKLEKIKNNFAINTVYLKNKQFNEPVYIICGHKNSVDVYSTLKNKKVTIKSLELDEDLSQKTFITVKDFSINAKKIIQNIKLKKLIMAMFI